MSKRKKGAGGTMLDLWRPPRDAGDPIGSLATTYTFAPGLFDEQCLGRFMEIESDPNREDLAFLLEREIRLGSVYAGVLVDHTQGGVEHSLRWDVLPVRVKNGKQHAKLSLLAWSRCVRIVVSSANLTEPGYRTNHEVAGAVDLTPDAAFTDILTAAFGFLRGLLLLVPGAATLRPEVVRAGAFLDRVEKHVAGWRPIRKTGMIRRQLVFTLPGLGPDRPAQSSLEQAIQFCRARGGSPERAWVASPFFDKDEGARSVTASFCKLLARGLRRELWFSVPVVRDSAAVTAPRLAAPKELLRTPPVYQCDVTFEMLPEVDGDKNRRPWHAKMLAFFADRYSALMIGSSNFTGAGMGVGSARNAEANLLTIVDAVDSDREARQLETIWPEMEQVANLESAEWLGARADQEEEEVAKAPPVPAGFLAATYRAGERRQIILQLEPSGLPGDWRLYACGRQQRDLLSSITWQASGSPAVVELDWPPVQPPDKLLVRWGDQEAFMTLNVENSHDLPGPAQLEQMSADDMLWILAAADPSAAFRAWAKRRQPSDVFDPELDSATPVDLDPLRRYDLQATFLHRIRRRARTLAQCRSNLQRPAWSRQALEWRLRGLVGVEALADRFMRELATLDHRSDEALLTLADFLIVLCEVDYQPSDGSLSKREFESVFRPFLKELAEKLAQQVHAHRHRVGAELFHFWDRVVQRCQG